MPYLDYFFIYFNISYVSTYYMFRHKYFELLDVGRIFPSISMIHLQ